MSSLTLKVTLGIHICLPGTWDLSLKSDFSLRKKRLNYLCETVFLEYTEPPNVLGLISSFVTYRLFPYMGVSSSSLPHIDQIGINKGNKN